MPGAQRFDPGKLTGHNVRDKHIRLPLYHRADIKAQHSVVFALARRQQIGTTRTTPNALDGPLPVQDTRLRFQPAMPGNDNQLLTRFVVWQPIIVTHKRGEVGCHAKVINLGK